MAIAQHRRETITRGNGMVSRDTRIVTEDTDLDNHAVVEDNPVSDMLARLVYIVGSVIVTLLLMRFALSLLGANRGNGIADFIYSASQPFAAPFFGLFNYDTQFGVARFEVETLVAAASYGLLTWLIVSLIEAFDRRTV
jgi:hypothetical protein